MSKQLLKWSPYSLRAPFKPNRRWTGAPFDRAASCVRRAAISSNFTLAFQRFPSASEPAAASPISANASPPPPEAASETPSPCADPPTAAKATDTRGSCGRLLFRWHALCHVLLGVPSPRAPALALLLWLLLQVAARLPEPPVLPPLPAARCPSRDEAWVRRPPRRLCPQRTRRHSTTYRRPSSPRCPHCASVTGKVGVTCGEAQQAFHSIVRLLPAGAARPVSDASHRVPGLGGSM